MNDPLSIWIEWFCAIVRCDSDRTGSDDGQALLGLVARYRSSGLQEGLPTATVAEGLYRAESLCNLVESSDAASLGLSEAEHAEVADGLHDMIEELQTQGG